MTLNTFPLYYERLESEGSVVPEIIYSLAERLWVAASDWIWQLYYNFSQTYMEITRDGERIRITFKRKV